MPTVQPENSPAHIVYAGDPGRSLVANERGDPIVPSEVADALRLRDPSLKIEWLAAAWGQSAFVIKQQWPQGDKRWARVQCGECDPANSFDVIARFPREIRTSDMLGWIERHMGRVRDPAKEAEALIARAKKLMEESMQGQADTFVESSIQRHLDESPHLREVRAGAAEAHPMVSGADFTPVAPVVVDREPKRLMDRSTPMELVQP